MRTTLAMALLSFALLAGCGGKDDEPAHSALDASKLTSPDGAEASTIAGGAQLAWPDAGLPFAGTITLPEGATMVRLVADPGESASVSLGMANTETGRRRCNNPTVPDFNHALTGTKSCSGLAAVDRPGDQWNIAVVGSGSADVRVEFLDTPLDGPSAQLDVSLLSQRDWDLKPTQFLMVPSFDGTPLRIEVTLPDGPGPWPAIIESSPYHDDGVRADPASFSYFVHDWAQRGYAVVVADVRGFGDSGGCVEVWGPKEQADQRFLVDWTAQQDWSDGFVGFYGQSYVGTTPVEAAVQAPEALKAIITVAPVVRAYDDWHFGGVPNGENLLSPVGYAELEDAAVAALLGTQVPPLRTEDPVQMINNAANGPCDPLDLLRPNDPRALYDQYYVERDFARRAGNIRAAVMYTHGFEDANVKAQMIPDWFNAIPSPKLGLFGHWLHQHPPRMDTELLMLAWMDQYVKGKPMGFEHVEPVQVVSDATTMHVGHQWPQPNQERVKLWPDLSGGQLGAPTPSQSSAAIDLDTAGLGLGLVTGKTALVLEGPVGEDLRISGGMTLHVKGTLTGAVNAYLGAELYDLAPGSDDASLVSTGQVNLAHNDDHTMYTPILPGTIVTTDMPFRPTEHIVPAGHTLRLVLRGVAATEATDVGGILGLAFDFEGGSDGTALIVPTLPAEAFVPIAHTATP